MNPIKLESSFDDVDDQVVLIEEQDQQAIDIDFDDLNTSSGEESSATASNSGKESLDAVFQEDEFPDMYQSHNTTSSLTGHIRPDDFKSGHRIPSRRPHPIITSATEGQGNG